MTDKIKPGSKARHYKRGSTYDVIGEASVQTGEPLGDYARVIVYRAHHDGRLWVRPLQEFSEKFEITDETDPRVGIVNRLERAAIDAAGPVEPPLTPETAPTMADMQRMTDDLLTDPVAMDAYMKANPLPAEPPADEEVASVIKGLNEASNQIAGLVYPGDGLSEVDRMVALRESDRVANAVPLIERQQAEIARLTKERDELGETLDSTDARLDRKQIEINDLRAKLATVESAAKDTITSLVAAVSLLERVGRVAAPSDKMFGVMLNDYKRGIERARTALYAIKEPAS